jgi:hypothetical protein
MHKVFVIREGPTEELFIEQVLLPHLLPLEVQVIPKPQPIQKYERVKKFVWELLRDTSAALVTTMFDYYALPKSFPRGKPPRGSSPIERVRLAERQFEQDIGNARFRAYFSLNEFEALLFSDPKEIATVLGLKVDEPKRIRDQFPAPEDIDDDPSHAPSKRLARIYPGFVKTVDGLTIAKNIGLASIRSECPHFHEWVTVLEAQGEPGRLPS